MTVLTALLEVERGLFRVVLCLLAALLLRAALRRPRKHSAPPLTQFPSVTVQLPMRNEARVAERAIAAARALDWPADKLFIDVLDDSDEPMQHALRRDDRDGTKAGNLTFGLQHARGEFIAIFDADHVPAPDFLKRTLPHFADPKVALVQGRLTFTNKTASLLTRAQAALHDALDREQSSAAHFHWNGSAAVWRTSVLRELGFAQEPCSEDVELSQRAIAAGHRFVHLSDVEVASELPEDMARFRLQQRRWTEGKTRASVLNLRHVFKAPALFFPALSRIVFAFFSLLLLTMPLTTFGWAPKLVQYTVLENVLLFLAVIAALAAYLRRDFWLAPVVALLLFGQSLLYATSFFAGLRRIPARMPTEKRGDGAVLPAARDRTAIAELLVAVFYAGFAWRATAIGAHAVAAFFCFVVAAFVWSGSAGVTDARARYAAAQLFHKLAGLAVTSWLAHRFTGQALGKLFFALSLAQALIVVASANTNALLMRRSIGLGDALAWRLLLAIPYAAVVLAAGEPSPLLLLVLAGVWLEDLYFAYGATFLGHARADLNAAIGVFTQILYVAAITEAQTVEHVALVMLLRGAALVVIAMACARGVDTSPLRLDPSFWRRALPFVAMAACAAIIERLDELLLGLYVSYDALATYGTATRLLAGAMFLPQIVVSLSFPRWASGGGNLARAIGFALVAGTGAAATAVLLGPYFFADRAGAIADLAPWLVASFLQAIVFGWLTARGHERSILAAMIAGALTIAALDVVLVPSLGIPGAALTRTTASLVQTVFALALALTPRRAVA